MPFSARPGPFTGSESWGSTSRRRPVMGSPSIQAANDVLVVSGLSPLARMEPSSWSVRVLPPLVL